MSLYSSTGTMAVPQGVFDDQPGRPDCAAQGLKVLVVGGLEQAAGHRVELCLVRPGILGVHPVEYAPVGHPVIDRVQLQDVIRFAVDFFLTQDFRLVVADKIGARQIAIGNLAGQSLRQRQANRLRKIGQEGPEIADRASAESGCDQSRARWFAPGSGCCPWKGSDRQRSSGSLSGAVVVMTTSTWKALFRKADAVGAQQDFARELVYLAGRPLPMSGCCEADASRSAVAIIAHTNSHVVSSVSERQTNCLP